MQGSDQQFARDILDAANELDSVEDMVAFEQSLQKLDILKANSKADRNSIMAAQKSHEKFSVTLSQMRSNPDSYFRMNMGNKEYQGSPRDIIKSNSLDFLAANIARMRNRKQFATKSESKVWDARIAMAQRTGELFRALHDGLAGEFAGKKGEAD